MPGEQVLLAGRYRVVRQLGRGGMGSVWLAEDTALDNHPVAVKMLPAVLVADRRAFRQLKDEALVSMRLVHPSVVQVRSFEENGGNPFLVSDYVDGRTLDDVLAERGRLPEEEALRLLAPVAAALDWAHRAGVVHRDVKPANVMVRRDGTPFVLDFGIAREVQETLTRVTGRLSSGTLLYMSPEQLRGAEARPAQDVYSFAATAYECLSGSPPFTRGQVEFQILNEPPPPLVPETPLSRAVLRGLAKRPEDRPATCAGVLSPAPPSASDCPQKPDSLSDSPPSKRLFWPKLTLRNPLIAWLLVLPLLAVCCVGLGLFATIWRTSQPWTTPLPSDVPPAAASKPNALDKAVRAKTDAEMAVAYLKGISRDAESQSLFARIDVEKKRADDDFRKDAFERAIEGYKSVERICKEILERDRVRAETRRKAKETENVRLAEEAKRKAEETEKVRLAREEARRKAAETERARLAAEAKRKTEEAEKTRLLAQEEARRNAAEAERARRAAEAQRKTEVQRSAPRQIDTEVPFVKVKTVLLPNGVPLEMVWCGPSVFEVRPGVLREHKQGFWIAKYELTQRQWKSVMRDNPSDFKNDTLPVENLSWNDCARFIMELNARSSLTFRLPTGAEWEYAARGGPKGEVPMPLDDFAWWWKNADGHTHVGGGRKANALGLHDVLGNVWEWCSSLGEAENAGKREIRGGCFENGRMGHRSLDVKEPTFVNPDERVVGGGMRLVCDRL